MPLSKLFHKRNCQKTKKNVPDSTDCDSAKAHEENITNLNDEPKLCEEIVECHPVAQVAEGSNIEVLTESRINDGLLSTNTTNDSEPEELKSAKSIINRRRSTSDKDIELSLKPGNVRRKYGSESEAIENHIKEEGFRERLIQLREKDLEDVIGRYVNKLVQDSIVSVVKNVNIDCIYEELVGRASDRKQSESSDEAERTLSEDVLLCGSEDEVDSGTAEEKSEEYKNLYWEIKEEQELVAEGYNADCEESASFYSTTSDSKGDKNDVEEHIPSLTDVQETFQNSELSNVCDGNVSDEIGEVNESRQNMETSAEANSSNSRYEDDLPSEIRTKAGSINLIRMSSDDCESPLMTEKHEEIDITSSPEADLGENIPEQRSQEEEKKKNWKVGYLHVKLPHKSRGKGHLKVWKKRCVAIQPDEFVNDPKNPCLMISVYSAESGTSRKHNAHFWKSVSCNKAVVYRSSSKTHKYAFTVSDDNKAVIHLAADSESAGQEWMAAIRAILWPPSPVMQLEKMLNGSEFEISIIDNEFSFRAGLLGMYGYLTITPKKLILVHPQQGYVIQEWYLNTVDKFQLMPQTRIEDVHKVLAMTTCSDSSTGKGDILIYCIEAVALLQSLASTIHQILTYHSKQEGGKYKKELEEIADWLVAPATQGSTGQTPGQDYYKVPPRQVKSLLDIPNFIFEKPLTPVASVAGTTAAMSPEVFEPTLETSRLNPATASHDSGISSGTSADDFLNCSTTSFVVGGGPFPGKSSDSDLSDSYSPPRTPETKQKMPKEIAGQQPACIEA